MQHDCRDLVAIFNAEFSAYRTQLVPGGEEPFYQAAKGAKDWHRLIFREDFFASALHECAHWCIAGERRRLLDDFGYWYQSTGRDEEAQNAFYQAEVKSQALEWVFALSCGYVFSPSLDNLGHHEGNVMQFKNDLAIQKEAFLKKPPQRAGQFMLALLAFYQPYWEFSPCSN